MEPLIIALLAVSSTLAAGSAIVLIVVRCMPKRAEPSVVTVQTWL